MDVSRTYPLRPVSRLLLLAAGAALAACVRSDPDDSVANLDNGVEDSSLNLPSVPLPEPPMDRAALLEAIAQAASAAAAGSDQSAAQRALDGRPFELRIRFGCGGPTSDVDSRPLGWTFDPEDRTLRIRATPTISGDDPIVTRIEAREFEAVEGFWVPRPWLRQSVCPAGAAVRPAPAPSGSEPAAPAAPTTAIVTGEDRQESRSPPPERPLIGIAQFYTSTDSRAGRRSTRAYQAVKTLEPDQPLGSQGFNLVLSGRLRALPRSGVIRCASDSPDTPPSCIVSADFDRVWIERPDTREILAEWGSG